MDNSESVPIKLEPKLEPLSNEYLCDEYSNYEDKPEFIDIDSKLELNELLENKDYEEQPYNLSLKKSSELKIETNNGNIEQTIKNPGSPAFHSKLIKCEHTEEEHKNTNCVNNGSQNNCLNSKTESLQTSLNKKYYKCKNCEFETTKLFEYSLHLFFHKTGRVAKPLICLNCRFTTLYKDHLETHMIRHRNPIERDMYKCKICEFETFYQSSLKHHMLTHKSDKKAGSYQCTKCPYQSGYLNNLKKHILHRHKDPEESKLLKCSQCGYRAIQRNQIKSHIKNNHEKVKEEVSPLDLIKRAER